MQSLVPPSMSSSRAQSRGTSPSPRARAAAAGNMAWMSSVAVKTMLMRSSLSTPFRSSMAATSVWTRPLMASTVSCVDSGGAPEGANGNRHEAAAYFGCPDARPPRWLRPGRPWRGWPACLGGRGGRAALGSEAAAAVSSARTSAAVSGRHCPGEQAPVGDRADAGPHQTDHRVPDDLAHAPDLAVAALVDDDAQAVRLHEGHLGRGGESVVELDPLAEATHLGGSGDAGHDGQVLLLDPVAGVGQAVGQVPVVGQHQQPLGVDVEAADGKDPGVAGHQVDHGGPALGVGRRGDHPRRLVEQVVHQAGPDREGHAVDGRRRRPPRRPGDPVRRRPR